MFVAVTVTGCTYVSDEPLVDSETADFPFAAITVGATEKLGESLTFARRGDSYSRFDAGRPEPGYLLSHVADTVYVLQLPGYSYTAIKLDLDANRWGTFDPPVPEDRLPSGLSRCKTDRPSTVCVSSLPAFKSLVLEAIAAGFPKETTEVPWVSQRIGTLPEGLRAFQRGDLAEALTILRPLAADGITEAQVALGNTFYVLNDPTADEKAVAMFRVAAEAGEPSAQNNLGVMYENGRGGDQDFEEAAKWYRLAAAQGNQQATKNWNDLWTAAPVSWSGGLALPESHRWVQVASRMDLDDAIAIAEEYAAQKSRVVASQNKWFAVVLGPVETTHLNDFRALYRGPALPDDAWLARGTNFVATIWAPEADQETLAKQRAVRALCGNALNNARTNWDSRSLYAEHVAEANRWRITVSGCRSSLGLPELVDPAEIARREAKATRELAESGNATAQNVLGNMYLHGQGVPQDDAEAVTWFRKAAEQGHPGSQFDLAFMYANGRGVKLDEAEALNWYRKAARQGYEGAQTRVSELESKLAPEQSPPSTEGVLRAVLYEEPLDTSGATVGIAPFEAAVAWSPLQNGIYGPEIVANLNVRERSLKLKIVIRRNTDETLPASHIVEVVTDTPTDFPGGGVRDVPRIVFKPSEDARGQPLIGASARVAPGFFWIALSSIPHDVTFNVNLLRERVWIDLPLVYGNGQRAILTFEKGRDGQDAFDEALASWARAPQPPRPKQPEPAAPISGMSVPALCTIALNLARTAWDARPVFATYVAEAKHRDLSVDDCRAALDQTKVPPAQTVTETVPVVTPPSPVSPAAVPQTAAEFTNGGIIVRVSRCQDVAQCQTAATRRKVVNAYWVDVAGDIEEGDGALFKRALLTAGSGDVFVSLRSEGGSLWDGIEIGSTIWNLQYATVVEPGRRCASACAFAWLAGRPRYAGASAEIGFHAPWLDDAGNVKSSAPGSAVTGGYLNSIGIPSDAIYEMTAPEPDEDLMWLTSDEAKRLRIPVEEWPE